MICEDLQTCTCLVLFFNDVYDLVISARTDYQSSYFISTYTTSWIKAVETCHSLGGFLVKVDNVEEWDLLKALLYVCLPRGELCSL